MSESSPPFKSAIPEITRPDFRPNVPAFLLEGASEQDRYIIEHLSLLSQYTEWSVNTELSTHDQVVKTNGRLLKAESDVRALKEHVQTLHDDMAAVKPITSAIRTTWRVLTKKPVMILIGLGFFFVAFYLYPYLLKEDPLSLFKDIVKAWLGA